MTKYVNLRVISELQIEIMEFVDIWVRNEKTPVPRKEIINSMEVNGKKHHAVKKALIGLLRQGYLRKAIMDSSVPLNKAFYVQLKRV